MPYLNGSAVCIDPSYIDHIYISYTKYTSTHTAHLQVRFEDEIAQQRESCNLPDEIAQQGELCNLPGEIAQQAELCDLPGEIAQQAELCDLPDFM